MFAKFSDEAMVQLTETVGATAASRPAIYLVLVFSLLSMGGFLWFMHKKDLIFTSHIQTHEEAENARMKTMTKLADNCHDVATEHIKVVAKVASDCDSTMRELRPVLHRIETKLDQ